MASKLQPLLSQIDLDQMQASLDSIALQEQRMQLLESCGHQCDQYRALAAELKGVLRNYIDYYHKERALLAQQQSTGG